MYRSFFDLITHPNRRLNCWDRPSPHDHSPCIL